MSVSTTITFLKDRNYHKKMVDAVKALEKVGVEKLPKELSDYFGVEFTEDAGLGLNIMNEDKQCNLYTE